MTRRPGRQAEAPPNLPQRTPHCTPLLPQAKEGEWRRPSPSSSSWGLWGSRFEADVGFLPPKCFPSNIETGRLKYRVTQLRGFRGSGQHRAMQRGPAPWGTSGLGPSAATCKGW